MGLFLFFFILFISISLIALLYVNGGTLSLSGADFFARGKELGLSTKEIRTLKKTSEILKMQRPLTILGSIEQIDKAILDVSRKLEVEGYQDIEYVEILEELYKIKKKSELRKSEIRNSITSSREIDLEQVVKIVIGNKSVPFIGEIVENVSEHIIVDFSKDKNFVSNSGYEGVINVYLWKKNDAGYYFETSILDGTLNKRWKIAHSNSLIRNQKREDIRVDVDIPGYIYKLIDISTRNCKSEGFSGTFVQLKNLSDGGAALLINGKVEKGTALKLEFKLLKKHIVICGILRESQYDSKLNCSLLRLKFIEPELEVLSAIRSFVYNINNEQDLVNKDKMIKAVENQEIINNNDSSEATSSEEIPEVEYLPEDCGVFN